MRRCAPINRGSRTFEVGVAWHSYRMASTRRRPRVPSFSGGGERCRRHSEEEEDKPGWGPLISETRKGGAVDRIG